MCVGLHQGTRHGLEPNFPPGDKRWDFAAAEGIEYGTLPWPLPTVFSIHECSGDERGEGPCRVPALGGPDPPGAFVQPGPGPQPFDGVPNGVSSRLMGGQKVGVA